MKVLDLFSGIGGFSLGLERAGMETVAFCEFDKNAQKVLAKRWPGLPIYDDVRTLTKERLDNDGITDIDVLCGGFPCQDVSVAGKKAGFDGERSSLYREMLRIVGECLPRYAIFENVTGLLTGEQGRWFGQFLYDLASIGYDAEWHCISASELGAHHHRDRVWIIAYPKSQRESREGSVTKQREQPRTMHSESGDTPQKMGNPECGTRKALLSQQIHALLQESNRKRSADRSCDRDGNIGGQWAIESPVGRVADGVPRRSHRLKQLGNAVVPQIPEIIGRAIMEVK
jgi:DNA (cytosine-5)-methyltransferase 1